MTKHINQQMNYEESIKALVETNDYRYTETKREDKKSFFRLKKTDF